MGKFADLPDANRTELIAAAEHVTLGLQRVFLSPRFRRYVGSLGHDALHSKCLDTGLTSLRAMSMFVREQSVVGSTDHKWAFVDGASFALEAVTDAWPYMEFSDRQRYLRWSDDFLKALSGEFLEAEPAL